MYYYPESPKGWHIYRLIVDGDESYVSRPWATGKLAKREVVRIALSSTKYVPYPIPQHCLEYYNNLASELNFEYTSSEGEEEDWSAFDDVGENDCGT